MARWQRLEGYVGGVYACKVVGTVSWLVWGREGSGRVGRVRGEEGGGERGEKGSRGVLGRRIANVLGGDLVAGRNDSANRG